MIAEVVTKKTGERKRVELTYSSPRVSHAIARTTDDNEEEDDDDGDNDGGANVGAGAYGGRGSAAGSSGDDYAPPLPQPSYFPTASPARGGAMAAARGRGGGVMTRGGHVPSAAPASTYTVPPFVPDTSQPIYSYTRGGGAVGRGGGAAGRPQPQWEEVTPANRSMLPTGGPSPARGRGRGGY